MKSFVIVLVKTILSLNSVHHDYPFWFNLQIRFRTKNSISHSFKHSIYQRLSTVLQRTLAKMFILLLQALFFQSSTFMNSSCVKPSILLASKCSFCLLNTSINFNCFLYALISSPFWENKTVSLGHNVGEEKPG